MRAQFRASPALPLGLAGRMRSRIQRHRAYHRSGGPDHGQQNRYWSPAGGSPPRLSPCNCAIIHHRNRHLSENQTENVLGAQASATHLSVQHPAAIAPGANAAAQKKASAWAERKVDRRHALGGSCLTSRSATPMRPWRDNRSRGLRVGTQEPYENPRYCYH